MKTNSREEKREKLLLLAFGVYLAALLWVTLLSRIGSDTRHIYPPFWSFKAILGGSADAFWETIANIILFIPLGAGLKLITGWKRRYIVLVGLAVSVLVEFLQWWLFLGTTEIDDVVTNTIGVAIGASIFGDKETTRFTKKEIFRLTVTLLALIMAPIVFKAVRMSQMREYAALSDRDDGMKNLLVLIGDEGYVETTGMHVSYNRDGSIKISGQSDEVGYKLIGRLNLEPGDYTFSGFSGAEPNTVSIYLEKYDSENPNADNSGYIRFTPDLGPVDKTTFSLAEMERVRAYVKVYPGAEGEYTAKPVLYREG